LKSFHNGANFTILYHKLELLFLRWVYLPQPSSSHRLRPESVGLSVAARLSGDVSHRAQNEWITLSLQRQRYDAEQQQWQTLAAPESLSVAARLATTYKVEKMNVLRKVQQVTLKCVPYSSVAKLSVKESRFLKKEVLQLRYYVLYYKVEDLKKA